MKFFVNTPTLGFPGLAPGWRGSNARHFETQAFVGFDQSCFGVLFTPHSFEHVIPGTIHSHRARAHTHAFQRFYDPQPNTLVHLVHLLKSKAK